MDIEMKNRLNVETIQNASNDSEHLTMTKVIFFYHCLPETSQIQLN